MALPTRVTLPPAVRPVGGLLAAARPLGVGWERGVTFATPVCAPPQTVGECDNGTVEKVTVRPSGIATFAPFGIVQAIECSTLGGTDVASLADASIDVTREYAVARELLTGAASGNPNLGDAQEMTGATDPTQALGCLEQFASEQLSGRMVFVHASPAIGTAWVAAGAIWRDGRVWRTASGNPVVVSAGFDGREPGQPAPSVGDTLWAYATAEVYAEVGNRDTRESVDRTSNTRHAWAEEAGIVVFDPCFLAAIDTTVVYCEVGS